MTPTYTIDPLKLLVAAERLAPARAPVGRPSYTAHRRAVSTGYYAVFHAIAGRVVDVVFATEDPVFKRRVRRWINHGDIRQVALWVSVTHAAADAPPGSKKPRNAPPRHIVELLGTGPEALVSAEAAAVADGFLELNERREAADYDHLAVFRRSDTRRLLRLSRRTVELAQATDDASAVRFFGLIAMQAKVQAR